MSLIDYTDFTFSEDEHQQNHDSLDEDNSVRNFELNTDEDEDEASDHDTDTDEYASFFTDYERYQYDQLRWNGIPNSRKHTIAKKEKAVKSAPDIKSGKQSELEPRPKASRKGRSKQQEPVEDAVKIAREGEIDFDNKGALWYSHKHNNVYLSERATFHHWIRADLSQIENAKGVYDFPRKRGPGNYDVTCFNKVQEHWGLQRAHYAPVMFEWERLNRPNPAYRLDSLYYQDLLVLDFWRKPVRNFQEIPLVVSSAFEGGYMEPATRLHGEMAYEDFRARMPPYVEIRKAHPVKFKALSKASTLSGRSRHFREEAGAISWDKREGSANIKTFIENIVNPVNNSTRGSRDLTKDEVKKLRLMNHGSKPLRAKPGTSKESKEKYIANTRRAAGVTNTTQTHTDNGGRMDDDYLMDELMASIEHINNQEDESTVAEVRDAAPPRFVFCCTEAPFLKAITEQQALTDPLVNMSDPRNRIPRLSVEIVAIRDALQVTVDHFKEIFDFEPQVTEGANYITEYCNIQDQMDDIYGDDAWALLRLGRWEGTVFDWEQAEVQYDPCFGRKQPFGSYSFPPAWFDFRG